MVDEIAICVLGLFSEKEVGHGFTPSSMYGMWQKKRRKQEDLMVGLDYAIEQGWLEQSSNAFIALTQKGYNKISAR